MGLRTQLQATGWVWRWFYGSLLSWSKPLTLWPFIQWKRSKPPVAISDIMFPCCSLFCICSAVQRCPERSWAAKQQSSRGWNVPACGSLILTCQNSERSRSMLKSSICFYVPSHCMQLLCVICFLLCRLCHLVGDFADGTFPAWKVSDFLWVDSG